MPKKNLTPKQEMFCQLYVKYGIGAKAYMEAYPTSKDWKRNTLDCEVYKMLEHPHIAHRIEQLNEQKISALQKSEKLNRRKLLETALQMLEDTNNPAERAHAVSLLKLLFAKEGMTQPQNTVNVQVNNNTITAEVSDYLNL